MGTNVATKTTKNSLDGNSAVATASLNRSEAYHSRFRHRHRSYERSTNDVDCLSKLLLHRLEQEITEDEISDCGSVGVLAVRDKLSRSRYTYMYTCEAAAVRILNLLRSRTDLEQA